MPASSAGDAPGLAAVRVQLVWSPAPRTVWHRELVLTVGSTVADALQASGLPLEHAEVDWGGCGLSCWGRRCGWSDVLGDGDRIELLRPLKADPKVSRRLRYRGQADRRALGGGTVGRRAPAAPTAAPCKADPVAAAAPASDEPGHPADC